jgi:hypothetical protein
MWVLFASVCCLPTPHLILKVLNPVHPWEQHLLYVPYRDLAGYNTRTGFPLALLLSPDSMQPSVLHTQSSINHATYFKQLAASLKNQNPLPPYPDLMIVAAGFFKKIVKIHSINENNSLLGYAVIVIWQKFPHISEALEPLFCSIPFQSVLFCTVLCDLSLDL